MSEALRIVAAAMTDRGRTFYLVDGNGDFISELKELLGWKAAMNRAPAAIQVYCSRLSWYYPFLAQQHTSLLEATPNKLTEFVIWLCNSYQDVHGVSPIYQPGSIAAINVNLILRSVEALYHLFCEKCKCNLRIVDSNHLRAKFPAGEIY